jgi:ribosomal protein S18 acetylase RimI-like enzyme
MKIKLRRSTQNDLENIYQLHTKCFNNSDQWYRSNIQHHLDNGIIIELKDTNEMIGILLQGSITPCNKKMDMDMVNEYNEYKEDIFDSVNDRGKKFDPYKEYYGIVMICIHPNYRSKGLAKKLIEKHFDDNKDITICLNTRRSNINAYQLYKKMGYEHIGNIKNKYFLPSEDSIFMIKE